MGMLRRRHQERHELAAKGVEVQRDAIDADNTAETEPLQGVDDTREVDPDVIPVADTTKDGDEGDTEEGDVLKGEALDQALRDAGLPLTGKADEKRQRLAEHNA